MSQSEGGSGGSVDFLSTHPANAKRIKVRSALCSANDRLSRVGWPRLSKSVLPAHVDRPPTIIAASLTLPPTCSPVDWGEASGLDSMYA